MWWLIWFGISKILYHLTSENSSSLIFRSRASRIDLQISHNQVSVVVMAHLIYDVTTPEAPCRILFFLSYLWLCFRTSLLSWNHVFVLICCYFKYQSLQFVLKSHIRLMSFNSNKRKFQLDVNNDAQHSTDQFPNDISFFFYYFV